MLNPSIKLDRINHKEYIYYTKQLILENIGLKGQKRLKQAKILIIGAGGLGCPAMLYLITSGVGYIGIIDNDQVELSNLNRQIIYTQDDIKSKKVLSAKKKLKKINPSCKIITHTYNFTKENSKEITQYYDIILDTSDNFKTRYEIDNICYKLHKTYIYGAIEKFEGQVITFNYKNGIRYKDIYHLKPNINNYTCNDHGTMGITTGYIGILQATEAIKIILGIGKIINNYIIICNLLNTTIKKRKIYIIKENKYIKRFTKKSKNIEANKIISKEKFKYLMYEFQQESLIIDIRENNEFIKQHLKKSINIPLLYFKQNKTLKFITTSSNRKMLFIYCNKIDRSKIASKILNSIKVNHYIIKNK